MPHAVDIHVGQRLRQRRWMLGLTQQQLAERVGIRFQQIQKYETGENRMSASRLWDIAAALNVPIAHFYDGLGGPAVPDGEGSGDDADADGAATPDESGLLQDRETIQLVRAFYAMPRAQRQHLFDLARVLSHGG